MWLKSHHWVNYPYFRTERKKVLDCIRTPTLSFMLFNNKYYDHETNKFKTDKLKTLNSSICIQDLIESESQDEYLYHSAPRGSYKQKQYNTYPEKWFTPKDNDFDEEIRREEEEKERKKFLEEKELLEQKKKDEELKAIHEDIAIMREQYKNAEIIYLAPFSRNNYSDIHLKPGEEIILVNGKPLLDENGNIKIFKTA